MSFVLSWILLFYVGFAVVYVTHRGFLRLFSLPSSTARKTHVFVLTGLLLYPFFYFGKPSDASWTPWKAPIQIFQQNSQSLSIQVLKQPLIQQVSPKIIEQTLPGIGLGLSFLMIVGSLFFVYQIAKDAVRLFHLQRRSGLLHRYRNLRVYLSSDVKSPFSVWPARIFLPANLKRNELRICLKHELEHLRQGDLFWTLCQDLLSSLFFLLPGIGSWKNLGEEIFEIHCDESLLRRHGISTQEYGIALIQFGHQFSRRSSVGSAGMAASQQQLRRRLEMILRNTESQTKPWISKGILALTVAIFGGSALAASNLVKEHQMNLAQLKALATKSQLKTDLPIVVNQEVLTALNRAVGNPRGRFYYRKSLERMKPLEAMIKQQLKDKDLPEVLMAVPLIESGYQNVDNGTSAGIWQIIPDTARVLGLTVDDKLDERFHPEKATQAALKYMIKNQTEFQDWHLTILAYNAGERAVRDALENAGHKNAFQLIREGYLSPESRKYLPSVMAGILIYLNPELTLDP